MNMNNTDWYTNIENALTDGQKYLRDFVVNTPKCGLFLTMGGGKTLVTLSALATIQPAGNILVIAPKNIADNSWPGEIEKWGIPIETKSLRLTEQAYYKNGKPKKIRNLKPAERAAAYAEVDLEHPRMYFTALDQVTDLVEWFSTRGGTRRPDYSDWPFSTLILDESQSFKDPSTKRFKALRKVARYAHRIILLTGTPAAESLENLWSQTYLLDSGKRLGKSMTAFHTRWFRPDPYIQGKWHALPGVNEQIYDAIADIAVYRESDGLDLKGKEFIYHKVQLDPEQAKAYRQFKKDSILRFILDHDQDPAKITPARIQEVVSDNAAVLHNRLIQFATGAIRLDLTPDDPDYAKATEHTSAPNLLVHSHKYDRISQIVTDQFTTGDHSPILIAYRFIAESELIMQRINADGIVPAVKFDGSNEMYRAWNQRKIPIMLIHPKSAGHGLNLQHGGHTMIWSTLTNSGEQYDQTNARLDRPGQTDKVQIHVISTEGTQDINTIRRLSTKGDAQQELLDSLRRDFEDVTDLMS